MGGAGGRERLGRSGWRTGLRAGGRGLQRNVRECQLDGVARRRVDVLAAVEVVAVAVAPAGADAPEAGGVCTTAAARRAVDRSSRLVVTQRAGLVGERPPVLAADALIARLVRSQPQPPHRHPPPQPTSTPQTRNHRDAQEWYGVGPAASLDTSTVSRRAWVGGWVAWPGLAWPGLVSHLQASAASRELGVAQLHRRLRLLQAAVAHHIVGAPLRHPRQHPQPQPHRRHPQLHPAVRRCSVVQSNRACARSVRPLPCLERGLLLPRALLRPPPLCSCERRMAVFISAKLAK